MFARRQAFAGRHRPVGAGDRRASPVSIAPRARRRALPDGRRRPASATSIRSRARSSRRCWRSTASRTSPRRRHSSSASTPTRAPAIRSASTRATHGPRAATRPDAAGLPRDRQPGALHRDRRQLRQRAAVLAVDGLRHLGPQQLLGQPELPALPQHHARRAGRSLRRTCASRPTTRSSERTGANSGLTRGSRRRSGTRSKGTPPATRSALSAGARAGRSRSRTARFARARTRLAGELAAQGFAPGDVVSWMLPNGVAAASIFLGAMHGGYVVSPVSLLAQDALVAHTLAHSRDAASCSRRPSSSRACMRSWRNSAAGVIVRPTSPDDPGVAASPTAGRSGSRARAGRARAADVHVRARPARPRARCSRTRTSFTPDARSATRTR